MLELVVTRLAQATRNLGGEVRVEEEPHPARKRSLDLRPTFFEQLRQGPIAASQFAPVLRDSLGEIRKPAGW